MHPHHEHKAHKVEKRRVSHITKGYASGGGVHAYEAHEVNDKKSERKPVMKSAMESEGAKPKPRADKRARGGRTGQRRDNGGGVGPTAQALNNAGIPMSMLRGASDDTYAKAAQALQGIKATSGADQRARGGRTKKKGTTVNIINAPGHAMGGAPMGMPMPAAPMMPPGGAMPPRPPMAAGPVPPPGGMPGAMPGQIRRSGGAAGYAKGGGVKPGPAYMEGVRNGTQPMNSPGKNDTKDIGRKRVVTFMAGGKVEAPKGVAKATELPGGSGGGEARLAKEKRARRDYAEA